MTGYLVREFAPDNMALIYYSDKFLAEPYKYKMIRIIGKVNYFINLHD